MKTRELMKLEPSLIDEYLNEQRTLFRSKGVSEGLMYSHEIVPVDQGRYMLVKRDANIGTIDWDISGNRASITLAMRAPSDKVKINICRKGKYNDGARLIFSESLSVKVGEIEGFSAF